MDKHARVILNCMPPAHTHMPSPSLNILKSVLKQNRHSAEIIYWNIKFETQHAEWGRLFVDDFFELGRVMPFVYALAKHYNDKVIHKKVAHLLQITYKSSKIYNKGRRAKFFSELPEKTFSQLNEFLNRELKSIDFSNVLLAGFSAKFYQWVPALLIARAIKDMYPQVKIVIGGFDSKQSAAEMLKVFDCFDFAVWGEGEYPLLELTNALTEKREDFEDISGLVFREAGEVIFSEKKGRKFFDLDQYPKSDYDDFFSVATENKGKGEFHFYPIESNRGCNWNRCKFCVLGNGYKYRERNTDSVVDEIKTAIEKYHCGYFQYLDNNVLGSDKQRFENLIDKLTKFFIESDDDFSFFAEIIPFGMDAQFYKRLALAGFRMVQIGGESFSDSLIRKMKKQNSFSDNLLGYKCCIKYGIRAEGSNIITGIPGETVADINECMANIPFLRFFLGTNLITFDESPFSLEKLSKFYKELEKDEIDKYMSHFIYSMLPLGVKEKMERFDFFSFKKHPTPHARLWKKFFKTLESYYSASITYKIFRYENLIIYEEFNNKVKVASLVFDEPEQWEILVMANDRLVSFSELFETLSQNYRKMSQASLRKMLKQLRSQYLLYFDENYNKIVSVIDTDQVL
ncbi:MAG: radical SAM protein, partial [Bacteroidota bacterium]